MKKEECSTKIRIYRHAGHTRFGFFANRNERSPGVHRWIRREERKQTEKGEWKRGGFDAKRGAFDQNPPLFSGKFPAFAPYTATERSESE